MTDKLERELGEPEEPAAEEQVLELEERVVHIDRVSKVVKGGRHFGFRALVVVGNGHGSVGVGLGKAREVPAAIQKGVDRAKRNMVQVPLSGATIPHRVLSKFSAAQVLLKPASPGTGVIAGGAVRAVLEAAGIKDILTKSLGSSNRVNVAYATMHALRQLKEIQAEGQRRGKSVADLKSPWSSKDA
jgi:small subunit ribosomal protein S5